MDQEKMWDNRAYDFYKRQNRSNHAIPRQIVEYIKTQYLDIENVYDIGGGTGKFSVLFGRSFKQVTMTDISGQMLHYAKINAEKANLNNISFEKMDWSNNQSGQSEKVLYDLAFSSMCPATRNIQGARRMEKYSKKYCAIVQYICRYDSFQSFLQKEKVVDIIMDPHNDRTFVNQLFNHLWEEGKSVDTKVFREERYVNLEDVNLTKEYQDVEEKQIEEYLNQNGNQINRIHELALLVWK